MREKVRECARAPLALTALALWLLAAEREPEAHAWLLDAISHCVMRYATPDRARDARARTERALLESLRGGTANLALQSYRTLARLASGDDALQFLADAVTKRELPGKVTLGTQDVFSGYGALLAAGRAEGLRARLPKDDDATKWAYGVGAASPEAAEKARYGSTYLDAKEPP